jgi:hypothetical protein
VSAPGVPDDGALRGELFDGVTAAAVPVTVALSTTGELRIRGATTERRVALADCRITPQIGRAPRLIGLPDGASIETRDLERLAEWEAWWGRSKGSRLVHRLESRWRFALVAAAALVVAAVAVYQWGIPLAARAIAFSLPASANALLGQQAQPTLERLLDLQPSTLPAGRQAQLSADFAELVRQAGSADFEYELQFRSAPDLGPNALALPSGTILLTDQLVALAGSDEELLAVLAHEVTHVEQRHGIRAALQDSGAVFLAGALLGDLSSVTLARRLAARDPGPRRLLARLRARGRPPARRPSAATAAGAPRRCARCSSGWARRTRVGGRAGSRRTPTSPSGSRPSTAEGARRRPSRRRHPGARLARRMDTHDIVIAGAVRTPIGKFLGGLADVSAVELGAHAVGALLQRSGLAAADVDQVIFGMARQAGSGPNVARQVRSAPASRRPRPRSP